MSYARTLVLALLPAALCGGGICWAQALAAPPGFVASPEVYKVIAENDKYRVIEVIWKPGQKDSLHSHPDSAVYYITDCKLRNQVPGASPREGMRAAGSAVVQAPIASHTIENIGNTECRLIMFEPK